MSQILIIRQPAFFQPTNSDGLYFTLSADTNYDKFKYKYDLFSNGEKLFSGKVAPNPYGLGVVDVARVLNDYSDNSLIVTSGNNSSDFYIHKTPYFSRHIGDFVLDYNLTFGNEYSTGSGGVTGYTGIDKNVGDPAFPSANNKVFFGTMGENFFSNLEELDIDQFVFTGTSSEYPSPVSRFLTTSPRIRYISNDDYYTLSFTNFKLWGLRTSKVYYAEIRFYDVDNTLLDTLRYENIKLSGGGPRDICTEVYGTFDLPEEETQSQWNILNIGVGPQNIGTSNIPANTYYYTVTFFGLDASPTPTPTPTPTVTPPTDYSPWVMAQCCNPEVTIEANILSGFTGAIRVYNGVCYYAVEEASEATITFSSPETYSNCDSCNNAHPCRSGDRGTATPTPTPSIPASCPDYEPISETFQFNLVPDCNNFGNTQIMWRGRYGTYEYFRFEKKKIEGIGIERQQYQQYPLTYGSADPEKAKDHRGITDFSVKMNETHIVNTGFINSPDMNFLESLFTSDDVYLIDNDGNPFPINIVSTEFVRRNKGRERDIVNIQLEYQFSNNIKLLGR